MLQTVREWFRSHYPGDDPDELTIRARSGREVRHSFPVMPALTSSGTVVAPPAEAGDEDSPVIRAIFLLMYESEKRLTGGQIVSRLMTEHRNDAGFSQKHITNTLTALAHEGRLTSHPADPGDGLGRGYGLAEWRTESG